MFKPVPPTPKKKDLKSTVVANLPKDKVDKIKSIAKKNGLSTSRLAAQMLDFALQNYKE